ncbi:MULTISPECIES: sensor histidine kinase [Bacillaceae]|uniref:sensor histidine kinase n=1 Tax=Bacillaceae TaxID=186817 RepID=UPI000589432A|nr:MULTISPECIES: HAMP domain-containing sensor histidine kinase [Bacillus]KKB42070.1 sensor histidine kinase [Bacillus thermotolerans]MEC1903531.1 HAMP domain-containing sensor histidine kinase [Bacillus atrophaeus]MEC2399272.1 HAMP domain-containing sensor histidine kinase [Bacillus atrophaeus]MED4436843.1 HAMP domain-containing sensor histidine kinase [Bacillus atrophaeus]MED4564023.1 HAMP domain-containing sensor histidine kinase [Bacillus atrophaeus]
MKLRNRVAYYFVSRLFWLMLIWGLLIVISIFLFSFFLGHNKTETPRLSISKIVEHTNVVDQGLSVNSKIKEDLVKNKMWIQILDEKGDEVFSFNKPKSIPIHYIPGELVSDYLYPAKKGYQLSTWYKTIGDQKLTWVLGKPMTDNNPFLYWANNLWILAIIIIGILIALFFGRQLGAPLLYIVSWIENLSKGKYEEPFNNWNLKTKRRWRNKAKYKTYEELMQALSDLTSTLQRNTEERKLLEKTREEWLTGVSHDLKTPLSVIKGYTVLLSSHEYDWEQDKVRHFSNIMEERVEYMEQLLEDFNLTFQLKNDAVPIQLEQKDLVNVLNDILEQLKRLPESKNKSFLFETNKEQIFLSMDSKYLNRAFENLIANSIKHNPPGTNIKIMLHEDLSHPRQIHVLIEDDGVGMDIETVEHLFDRYFRGTSATSNNSGTGLGMAIARQIIIAHGGDIKINSKLHQGTQYKITFPLE